MPRLLSLNTYHYRRGGSDVVFLEHQALLRERGWDTAALAMYHPENEPSPWNGFFVDEIEFGQHYGPLQKLVMAGKVIYSFEGRRKLNALLAKFTPDLAHAHCIYHHISPSVLPLLKASGIPVVMTAHDLKLCCPAYKMLNRTGVCERCKGGNLSHVLRNRCLHNSAAVSALVMAESFVHRWLQLYRDNLDAIVMPSLFFKRKHMEWGWPEDKLVYIPNFVHAETFTPQFRPGGYFVYVGRLAPEKGLETLIRAAALAGAELRLIGVGPMETDLRALAAALGAKVEFRGYMHGEPLHEQLRGARALVLPSEWYENAPISVLEAYCSGKPVIGARIGGIPELILEEKTGCLFESGNVDDLAATLGRFAELPDAVIEEMGGAAREHAVRTYNSERYLDEMLSLYQRLGVRA
jgi:glycosyltransferase involved in cell wall biosynthesis